MAGFSEQTLQKKLSELNNTLPSIQTLSLWLIHHRKHSKTIVDIWLKEVRHERDPKKLLTMIYLSNDVIQNSRKRWPLFREHFQPGLVAGLSHVARHVNDHTLSNVRRVLDVWRERSVYDEEFLTRLTYSFTSNLSRNMLGLFNEGGGSRTPPRTHQKEQETTTNPSGGGGGASGGVKSSTSSTAPPPTTFSKPKAFADFGSPSLPSNFLRTPDDEEAEASSRDGEDNKDKDKGGGGGGGTKEEEDPNKQRDQDQLQEDIETVLSVEAGNELMNSLKQLENAASADVRTREQIAQFPPDVADLSKLKNVTSREEADRFSGQLLQADAMLTEYNARLKEELDKRKSTLGQLERFIGAHKRRVEDETKDLANWKEKLQRLSTYRQELLTHIQSLPDLSKLPDPSRLPPLPSAGDLFTK